MVKKINELKLDDCDGCEWSYVLLGEDTFYNMKAIGSSVEEILEYSKLTKQQIQWMLFKLG